jgi:NADPH:quinone reductase-like Zn-dependent oxidoreductase
MEELRADALFGVAGKTVLVTGGATGIGERS